MKRTITLLLIAILLLCPLLTAHADEQEGYVRSDLYLFEQEAYDRLNARAAQIYETRGVAAYFFYMSSATELIEYTKAFAQNEVPESDAIILGMNDSLYYFLAKGTVGAAVFTETAKDALWDAFSSVSGDAEGKIGAYFEKADETLASYFTAVGTPVPTSVPTPVPSMSYTKANKPTVVDQVGILEPDQVTALSKRLAEIGEKYQCDVIVAVVDSLGRKTAEEYADDFFDYNGYGYGAVPNANGTTVNGDGVLLLLSMEDRDFAVSTSGYGITAFTDYGIQTDLEEAFLPYLKNNRWYEAFNAYADRCDWLLNTARKGKPYDVGYRVNGVAVAIAAIVGILLAFIPVGSMKRQLTDVHESTGANSYLRSDSYRITQNSDVLIGTHVARTVHVQPQRSSGGGFSGGSSTHTSSSGGSHGGHSGKF